MENELPMGAIDNPSNNKYMQVCLFAIMQWISRSAWGGGGGQSKIGLWFWGDWPVYRILIEYLIAFDKVNDKLHDIPEEYRITAIWK